MGASGSALNLVHAYEAELARGAATDDVALIALLKQAAAGDAKADATSAAEPTTGTVWSGVVQVDRQRVAPVSVDARIPPGPEPGSARLICQLGLARQGSRRARGRQIFSEGLDGPASAAGGRRASAVAAGEQEAPKSPAAVAFIENALRKTVFGSSALGDGAMAAVVGAMTRAVFLRGESVVTQGEPGDSFWVLESGEARLEPSGRALHPGSYVGELALICGAPQPDTVVATTDVELWRLDADAFKELQLRGAADCLSQRVRWLQSAELFSALSPSQLTRVADALRPEQFRAQSKVFSQGDTGDKFYLIEEGTVEVRENVALAKRLATVSKTLNAVTAFLRLPERFRTNSDAGSADSGGAERLVTTLGPGDYFGEAALLTQLPRNASIVAGTDVRLLSVNRDTFSTALGPLHDLLEAELLTRQLQRISTLEQLPPEDLRAIVDMRTLCRYGDGEVVQRQGAPLHHMVVVKEGVLNCVEIMPDGSETSQRIRSTGYFGAELLVAEGSTAKVTATAVGVVAVYLLPAVRHACAAVTPRDTHDPRLGSPGLSHLPAVIQRQGDLVPQGLERVGIIGEGAFGQVWMVKSPPALATQRPVLALKRVAKQRLVDTHQVARAEAELQSLRALPPHPFTQEFFGCGQDRDSIYLLSGLVPGGELFQVMMQVPSDGDQLLISEPNARFYAANVALALEHLHQNKIVFRDLKPENVLVEGDGYLRLVDFGASKVIPYTVEEDGQTITRTRTYTLCGTPEYLPPECVLCTGHDFAVDLWGLGVLLFEMCFDCTPFETEGHDMNLLFRNICHSEVFFPEWFSQRYPAAADAIAQLLNKSPLLRLGATHRGMAALKQHPFFEGLDWEALLAKQVEAPFQPAVLSPYDLTNFEGNDHGAPHVIETFGGDQGQFSSF